MTTILSSADPLAHPGTAERFKAGVHFVLFAASAMCFGYGLMAYGQRREKRLLVNVGVYGSLMEFERRQIERHLGARL